MARIIFLLLLLPNIVAAEYGPYAGIVKYVTDGDTVEVALQIYPGLTKEVGVRIAGIDTPEIGKAKCSHEKALGLQAKYFAQDFVKDGGGLVVVDNVRDGKFAGRVVGDLYVGDQSLSASLLSVGLAKEWNGKGKKPVWCEDQ